MEERILVVIPHASTKIPKEIDKKTLSEFCDEMIFSENAETDRGTDILYDFRHIIKNKQLIFPISQVFINASRSSEKIEECVPIWIRGTPVYKKGKEPSDSLRKKLIDKYYIPFYEKIKATEKTIIFNGHSTIAGHSSLREEKLNEHVVLSNFMEYGGKIIKFAPDEVIDYYIGELKRLLPNLKIGKNSIYLSSYDSICAIFGCNEKTKDSSRVPVIHQETDESLYMDGNRINYSNVDLLRDSFARALCNTAKKFGYGK